MKGTIGPNLSPVICTPSSWKIAKKRWLLNLDKIRPYINQCIVVSHSLSYDCQTPLKPLYCAITRKICNLSEPNTYLISFRYHFETPYQIWDQTVQRLPRKSWTNKQTDMEKWNIGSMDPYDLIRSSNVHNSIYVQMAKRKKRNILSGSSGLSQFMWTDRQREM